MIPQLLLGFMLFMFSCIPISEGQHCVCSSDTLSRSCRSYCDTQADSTEAPEQSKEPNYILTQRHEIRDLSERELQELRDAFQTAFDNGKYATVAGDHGTPNWFCPHGDLRFLPWHRRFMNRFEEALGGISLPYWDWTKEGEPHEITDATYVDMSGTTRINPLSYGIKPNRQRTKVSRYWSLSTDLLSRAASFSQSRTLFDDHSFALESPHNTVHVQLGGDMDGVEFAAFVPIFWFHHNYVDKLWYEWQISHPNAVYPDEARGPMRDSVGTFNGLEEIENLSRWKNTRKSSGFLKMSAMIPIPSPPVQKKKLVMVLKGFQATLLPERVEVHCLGEIMGTIYSLGMSKPMEIFTDHPVDVTDTYQEKFPKVSIEKLMEASTCKIIEHIAMTESKTISPQSRLQILFYWSKL